MTIDFTVAEVEALTEIVGEVVEVTDPRDALLTAWLKLVRAQAERLAVPIPGVTPVGTADESWGLR